MTCERKKQILLSPLEQDRLLMEQKSFRSYVISFRLVVRFTRFPLFPGRLEDLLLAYDYDVHGSYCLAFIFVIMRSINTGISNTELGISKQCIHPRWTLLSLSRSQDTKPRAMPDPHNKHSNISFGRGILPLCRCNQHFNPSKSIF